MFKIKRVRTMLRLAKRRLQRRLTIDDISTDVSFLYPPPDGGWGWVVVLAAFVHSMLVTGFHNAFGVYMMSLLETFQSSNSQIAWIGSVSYAFIMIFGPVSGKLLQKYGAIKVAIIGALVVMFGLTSSSYTHDLRVLFLTHGILVGIGSSLASTPALIMVSLYFTTKRSFATGIVMAGGATGTLVQNILHHYLIQTLGWRASLRVYSGILTICIIAAFAYKPLQKRVVNFIIPYCKNFSSLVAICSLWGFFDAGNYVLLPVLTFDLMGPEKMTIAWGFMMAVNAISCFGPPFAGGMYDLFGNYNIGFIVTGICNIAAASILAFIPWLTNAATQSKKNYLNASVCEVTKTILPWQSPSSSLGSITSSFMESRRVSLEGSEHSLSKYSEKPSVKSIKSILKSEVTSFKSVTLTEPGSSTPHRKEDGVIFVDVEKHDSALFEQVESTTDLTPMEDEHKSETASFKGVTSASIKQAEHDTSSSHRQDVEKYDSVLFEQVESTADLTLMEEEPKSETASFKGMASASIKQTEHIPHRKEDGVAFLGVEDYDSDQEQFESTTSLTPRGDLNLATSETLPFNRETLASTKQAKGISHRKEDGVAFLDLEDSDSDQQEQLESTTDLRPLEDLITSETSSFKRGPAAFVKQAKGIPHRKEDGVAFLDLEDSDSDQQEQLENTTKLWPLEDLNTSETYFKRGPAAFVEQAKSIPHRKEDGVAFLDIEDSDSDQQEHLVESTTDLRPVEHLATPETESSRSVISASVQQTEPLCSTLRRKGDDVPILPGEVCDHDQQQQYKSIHALSSVEDLAKSEMASIKSETPTSVKEAEHVPHRKKDDVSSADDENEKRSELISSTND